MRQLGKSVYSLFTPRTQPNKTRPAETADSHQRHSHCSQLQSPSAVGAGGVVSEPSTDAVVVVAVLPSTRQLGHLLALHEVRQTHRAHGLDPLLCHIGPTDHHPGKGGYLLPEESG